MSDTARTTAGEGFRPDIEGLRGLAVMLVVIFHVGLALPGGFIGVDVFFVISGFLITGLLLRERERTGRIRLLAFYARRVRRLLPAAIVVIAVTLPLAYNLYAPLDRGEVLLDGAASALSVGNIRFALAAGDYFHAITTPSPFLHFWSLGVEEQFYFVWPGLLLLAAGGLAAARAIRLSVGAALVLVFIGSLLASVVLTEAAPNWAFYSLPTRAFELAAGGLLAVAAGLVVRVPGLLVTPLAWLGLAAIVWSAIAFDAAMAFPGHAALVPTVATVALIAAGGRRFAPSALLSVEPLRFLGRISYSLYLWHWPILILSGLALGFTQPRLAMGVLLIGLSVVVSAASWALVEEPFRRGLPALQARPGRTVFGGVAAILAVVLAANGMAYASNQELGNAASGISAPISAPSATGDYLAVDPMVDEELPPDDLPEIDLPEVVLPDVLLPEPTAGTPPRRPSAGAGEPVVDDTPRTPRASKPRPSATETPMPTATGKPRPNASVEPEPTQPTAKPKPQATAKPKSQPTPEPTPGAAPTIVAGTPKPHRPPTDFALSPNVQPALVNARNDRERIWYERCLGNVEHTAPRPGCVYGNKGGSYTVALVGDSHAAHFFPAFEWAAQQNGWRLLVMVKVSCTFTDMRVRNILLKREYTECASWNEGVVARLGQERPNLTVVINNRAIFPVDAAEDTFAAKAAGVARMMKRLPGKVVLMADSPRSAYDVPACLSSNLHDIRSCATGRKKAFGYHGVIETKVVEQARVPLIDISARICTDNPCPAVVDNMIVYRDSHHLTATFARSLGPELQRLLNKVR